MGAACSPIYRAAGKPPPAAPPGVLPGGTCQAEPGSDFGRPRAPPRDGSATSRPGLSPSRPRPAPDALPWPELPPRTPTSPAEQAMPSRTRLIFSGALPCRLRQWKLKPEPRYEAHGFIRERSFQAIGGYSSGTRLPAGRYPPPCAAPCRAYPSPPAAASRQAHPQSSAAASRHARQPRRRRSPVRRNSAIRRAMRDTGRCIAYTAGVQGGSGEPADPSARWIHRTEGPEKPRAP
jgi:hypothetical protein